MYNIAKHYVHVLVDIVCLWVFCNDILVGKIRNNIIKQKMNVTRSLLEDIKTKQLKWYGHVQRMEEGRLPKKSYEMEPTRKKKTR